LTTLSIRGCKDKKWITTGLKLSSKEKNRLYQKYLTTRSPDDQKKYELYKKVFEKATKVAEEKYYNAIFDSRCNSSKTIWKEVNKLCSFKKSKSKSNIEKLVINQREILDPQQICDEMNSYFSQVGESLSKKLPKNGNFKHYLDNSVRDSMFLNDITHEEILYEISRLAARKAAGPDNMGSSLIKEFACLFTAPLAHIYNRSLLTGIFPNTLKIAKVIPLFKKGDKHCPTNYRPISLLSIFDKIFEKIICRRLSSFLEKNNILYDYQFGFRKSHTSTLALV
jgi:hypothetical protein